MERLHAQEEKVKKMKETRQAMENTIEEAKWNMYAERWNLAEKQLEGAKNKAVSLRDKAKIDEILKLLGKCKNHQKVEVET